MRPARERLENIMKDAHLRADDAGLLAAEVLRLRALLEECEEHASNREALTELEQVLARVEALPAKWRDDVFGDVRSAREITESHADALEAALKEET